MAVPSSAASAAAVSASTGISIAVGSPNCFSSRCVSHVGARDLRQLGHCAVGDFLVERGDLHSPGRRRP